MANKSRDRGTLGTLSPILVRVRDDSGPLDFIPFSFFSFLLFFFFSPLLSSGIQGSLILDTGINNSSNEITR